MCTMMDGMLTRAFRGLHCKNESIWLIEFILIYKSIKNITACFFLQRIFERSV